MVDYKKLKQNENRRRSIYRDLQVQPTLDNKYVLLEDYIYEDITVPKGYVTNGADIPRFLWWFIPPFKPKYLPAVIVHDLLCEEGKYKLADDLFEKKLFELDKNFEIESMVKAVRIYHLIK